MNEMARQVAASRQRMAEFGALPKWLRRVLDEAPVKPDTIQVAALFYQARRDIGGQRAREWILASVAAMAPPYWKPLKTPGHRSRSRSPVSHKLAPAVPEVARR